MDKPAIIRALEADPRMIDYAGMAMYKIREPKGSTRLTFEQISAGKQKRNRELALNLITQVLERYPDPKTVQSVEEVKEYMADVMYHTLAPNKAEHFPLDKRTPFAKAYYREKAESFFYDFLSPIADYSSKELPTAASKRLSSSQFAGLPAAAKPKPAPKQVAGKRSGIPPLQTGHTREQKQPSAIGSGRQSQPGKSAPKANPKPSVPPPQAVTSTDSQAVVIGCLALIIIVLLVLLLIQFV